MSSYATFDDVSPSWGETVVSSTPTGPTLIVRPMVVPQLATRDEAVLAGAMGCLSQFL